MGGLPGRRVMVSVLFGLPRATALRTVPGGEGGHLPGGELGAAPFPDEGLRCSLLAVLMVDGVLNCALSVASLRGRVSPATQGIPGPREPLCPSHCPAEERASNQGQDAGDDTRASPPPCSGCPRPATSAEPRARPVCCRRCAPGDSLGQRASPGESPTSSPCQRQPVLTAPEQ